MTLDAFTSAYIATALSKLSEASAVADIAPDVLATIVGDCWAFQEANAADVAGVEAEAGRGFCLTRNGYDGGFWSGGWPKGVRRRLGLASRPFRPDDLYSWVDGKLYSPLAPHEPLNLGGARHDEIRIRPTVSGPAADHSRERWAPTDEPAASPGA